MPPSSVLSALLLASYGCARPSPPPSAAVPAAPPPIAQAPTALLADTALGLAYSGYRAGQRPGRGDDAVLPSAEQVREDLGILVQDGNFGLIRLYDSGPHSEMVLDIIEQDDLPMHVVLGAWLEAEVSNHEGCAWLTEPIPDAELAANTTRNREEVARAVRLALAHPDVIVAVNVGNEALVSWNDHMVTADALVAYARQVQDAVPQPVSTADNYVAWVEHADVLGPALDFAMVHTYPQWEGKTIGEAMPYTLENLAAVRAALPDEPLAIGEAGWATVASEFGERANEADQERYYQELTGWAAEANVTTFVFEAFDEPWKGDPNDPLGAEKHWGLFTEDRRPKQVMRSLYPDLAAPPAPAAPGEPTPR